MSKTSEPRVVLDANVYISAFLSPGKPREILELARKGKIRVLISEPILSEIERVLRTKLRRPEWQITTTLSAFKNISTLVFPSLKLSVIKEHEADNRIIECAVEGTAQYVISGDRRHVLPLKEYQGVKILSPTEFLKEIEK